MPRHQSVDNHLQVRVCYSGHSNKYFYKEVTMMHRYNTSQLRAKLRVAQWRAKQEANRRMRELERKLKQALKH